MESTELVTLRAQTIALAATVRASMTTAFAMQVLQAWTASSRRAPVRAAVVVAGVLGASACAQPGTGASDASTHRRALLRATGMAPAYSAGVCAKPIIQGTIAGTPFHLPSTALTLAWAWKDGWQQRTVNHAQATRHQQLAYKTVN